MLRKNVIASYLSQFYCTLVSVIVIPIYIKYMGAEAYGLIGFFSMIQALFNLLDIGITPTVARESARLKNSTFEIIEFRQLLFTLEVIFIILAFMGGIFIYLSSSMIAENWLNSSTLTKATLSKSLQIIAIIVALRWTCGLYRSVLNGFEYIEWLGKYNAIIATLRYLLIIPIIIFFNSDIIEFFVFQLVVAFLELILIVNKTYHHLPRLTISIFRNVNLFNLKPLLKFSASIAFTSLIWVIVTQLDKLVLSKILPLSEYGFYTLAVLVANGILVINAPIGNASIPRMTKLFSENKKHEFYLTYKKITQFICIAVDSVSIFLFVFAYEVVFLWTGDSILSNKAAPILQLYCAGNGVLGLTGLPFVLQYANGNLRYHFIGNILFSTFLIPSIVFFSVHFGAIGAGYTWFISNLLILFTWTPYIHHKLNPDLNINWFKHDVFRVIIPMIFVGLIEHLLIPETESVPLLVSYLVISASLLLITGIIFSTYYKYLPQRFIYNLIRK